MQFFLIISLQVFKKIHEKSLHPVQAMNCKKGGFIHMRHNDLRDLEACLLSEVCKDVAIKPLLLPLTGEELSLSTSNYEDSARLDLKARGFYRPAQTAFFDVRVTNLNAKSQNNLTTERILKNAENEKKREHMINAS